LDSVSYGEDAKVKLFPLQTSWTFLNHGAFGLTFSEVLEESQRWRLFCDGQPLRFYDRELFPLLAYSIRMMAAYVDCPPSELFLIENVTYGLNCIVNSLQYTEGDTIVCFSLTYGSTKKILKELCTRFD